MKAIKRTIAGLLATLMFATCFNFNLAFGAEEYTDDEAIVVSKINAAGVMTGTENGFEPTKTLTRAEAAAIIVRMKGIPDSQVTGAKGDTLFTDVPASHWAAGYINAASSLNIINGVGNGLFLPDKEVTIIEFATMVIRAIGAGQLVDSLGTWPTNYVNFAGEEGLLEGVIKVYTANATRMDAAFMAVNALESPMWEKRQVTNTSEVTYVKSEYKTLLNDVLEITTVDNAIIYNIDTKERHASFDWADEDEEGACPAAGWGNFDIVDAVELATFKPGMEVDVWAKVKNKEIVRIAPAEISKQTEVKFSQIKKIDSNDKITLVVEGAEKKYSLIDDEDMPTLYTMNTLDETFTEYTNTGITALKDMVTDDGDFLFGTAILSGSKVKYLYIEMYENQGVVKEIKNDTIYFETATDVKGTYISKIDLDDDDLELVVTKDGKEIKASDIEVGDAVYYYVDSQNSDRIIINVNNKTVTGEVTNIATDKYIKIDGERYDVTTSIDTDDLNTGDEVKLYLNDRKEVQMFEIVDGEVDSTVALVKSLRNTEDKYKKPQLEVILVQLDGTELEAKEIDIKETVKKLDAANEEMVLNAFGFTEDYEPTTGLADDPTDPEDLREALFANSLVGDMIRFTQKGGKVVVTEFFDKTSGETITSFTEAKINTFAGDYNEKSGRINGTNSVRLNDNTVIYTLKTYAFTEAKSAYSCKFEKIDFEDLGSTDDLEGYVLSKNKDTDIAKAVLFVDEPSRATDKNYAVVLEVSNTKDDDYPYEVTLLLNSGKTEEVKIADDNDLDIDWDDVATIGTVLEVFIKDDVLDDCEVVSTSTLDDMYVYVFNGDGSVKVSTRTATDADDYEVVNIADDCIFVEIEEDGDYVKGKESDIKTLAEDEYYGTTGLDATNIFVVVDENTETEEDEIVAIFYVED